MKTARIHIRLEPKLAKFLKAYAKKRKTTITHILESHIRQIYVARQIHD